MDMVIDTSALIAVIANEPKKPALVECTVGATLLAPASVHWEIGNAFSAMLKRGRVTLDQIQRALEIYRQIPVRFVDVDIGAALSFSDRFQIYAYDAYMIVAASQHNCPLLTLDGGLKYVANQAGVQTMEVSR